MTVDHGRTLGEQFRNTRTAAGASIEQVEADLRIKAKYIEAIEDGDAAALPSRAYTDGFLRNYATYLGLDPADAVRRFASENGIALAASRSAAIAPMPKARDNALNGFSSQAPRRSMLGSLGRGVFALWPLVLVGGFAFVGYTGFVAARDAGLIPPQLGGAVQTAKTTETPAAAPEKPEPNRTAEVQVPAQPASPPAAVDVAEAKPDLVGSESTTGRPDSLSYARRGSTPYWQAKPPAVEPADGPVSEIEPETAGLLRGGRSADENKEDKPSRWTATARAETAPADVDASRIAAEAREALFGSLAAATATADDAAVEAGDANPAEGIDVADGVNTPDDATGTEAVAETPLAETAVSEPSIPNEVAAPSLSTSEIVVQTLPLVPTPPAPTFGIGPVVTQDQTFSSTLPAPAQPANAPRRFALVAGADAWVQITDAVGNVTYTGILSPGEAYNIPAQQGYSLKTGNAGGLFIEMDGQRFGPLGGSGTVKRNIPLNPGSVRASFSLSQAASLSQ